MTDFDAAAQQRPYLLLALDGFMSAGQAPTLIADVLKSAPHRVVVDFDVDAYYDYRARRPPIMFDQNRYRDLDAPALTVCESYDGQGRVFYFLTGPEPDYRWETFARTLFEFVEDFEIGLVLSLGAVPMGVPHTRPLVITAHGTRPELVDRPNVWEAEILVPSSAMSYSEFRLAEQERDAAGYVVHVPHYLAQVEYPTAALALLETVSTRTGLAFDLDDLRRRQAETLSQIEQQIEDQDGGDLLADLEQQYDAFTRGSESTLLSDGSPLPTADELAQQFQQFLAARDTDKDND